MICSQSIILDLSEYLGLEFLKENPDDTISFFENDYCISVLNWFTKNQVYKKYIDFQNADGNEQRIHAFYIKSAVYEWPALIQSGSQGKSIVFFENKFEFDNQIWTNFSWCKMPLHSTTCGIN